MTDIFQTLTGIFDPIQQDIIILPYGAMRAHQRCLMSEDVMNLQPSLEPVFFFPPST